jgi:hypothetical protein
MKKPETAAWMVLIALAFFVPIVSTFLGYWLFNISLPTLMFISFLLLLFGSMACWPASDRESNDSSAIIFLILGQSSGVGILVIFVIRLYSSGLLFTWSG